MAKEYVAGGSFFDAILSSKIRKRKNQRKEKTWKNEIFDPQKAALAQKTGTVAQDLLKCEKKGVI